MGNKILFIICLLGIIPFKAFSLDTEHSKSIDSKIETPSSSPTNIPLEPINEVKMILKDKYNLDFSTTEFILNPNTTKDEKTFIQGYSNLQAQNNNFSKEASLADLKRNYIGFTKGINFEIDNNNLKLNYDDLLKKYFKDENLKENKLVNETVYSIGTFIENNELNLKASELISVAVFCTAEINNKKNILEAYQEARHKALITGLKAIITNYPKFRGKLYLQKILYNSIDSDDKTNLFSYAVQFCIDKKTIFINSKSTKKNLSKYLNEN